MRLSNQVTAFLALEWGFALSLSHFSAGAYHVNMYSTFLGQNCGYLILLLSANQKENANEVFNMHVDIQSFISLAHKELWIRAFVVIS